ncbi:helix-turn-helix domain-containing protein [Paractinoplanes toevensis]|uniref:HTH cro/C1-type domain-containing protein n=1 Tax=Paractinoplanes toevensis TaxID=571911 RepID=A0A919W7J0_9ACTN|nr:helix-turn-helix transcriptional regulator [Actinoplanes toevensis]GIM89301.1 hypothetical protein Ato02nite_010940 [Actinoplanes toevensis]
MSTAVVEALTFRRSHGPPDRLVPADQSVLAPFLDTLLGELPWWNRGWRVAEVGAARSSSSSRALSPEVMQVVEVTVPGLLNGDAGEVLPFSARVRFLEDRLLRWQMKIGEVVIGPGLAPAGEPEPHAFGAVFQLLAEMRGLSFKEVAHRTGRAESTINRLRAGALVPERMLIEELARALDLPAASLAVIAGLDPADPGRARDPAPPA